MSVYGEAWDEIYSGFTGLQSAPTPSPSFEPSAPPTTMPSASPTTSEPTPSPTFMRPKYTNDIWDEQKCIDAINADANCESPVPQDYGLRIYEACRKCPSAGGKINLRNAFADSTISEEKEIKHLSSDMKLYGSYAISFWAKFSYHENF